MQRIHKQNWAEAQRPRAVCYRSTFCSDLSVPIYGPGHAKMSLMPYVNNKGADQHLCCSLLRQYDMYTCYIQSFKILATFCSWAGWFESFSVWESPKTWFLVTWFNYDGTHLALRLLDFRCPCILLDPLGPGMRTFGFLSSTAVDSGTEERSSLEAVREIFEVGLSSFNESLK